MNWAKVRVALESQSDKMFQAISKGAYPLETAKSIFIVAELCRTLAIALKFGMEDEPS